VIDTLASATSAANATSNAGTSHAIVASGANDTNYDFTYVNGLLSIGKRDITGTVNVNASRAYGASNPVWDGSNVTWNNLANSETGSVLDALTVSAPTAITTSNAGTSHAVNISGFSDNNYNLTGFTAGNLNIAELVVVTPPVVVPPITNNLLSSSVERAIPEIILSNNKIENKAPQIEPTSSKKTLVNTVIKSESKVIKNSGFSLIRYTDALINYLSLRSIGG
jgi:hypothetical protein